MLKITCLPLNEKLYVRCLPFILHNAEPINPDQEEKAADCSRAISTPSDSTRSMSIFLLPLIPKIICHLQSKGFLKVNLQPTASLSSSLPPPPPIPLTLPGCDQYHIDQLSLSLASQTNHLHTSSTLSLSYCKKITHTSYVHTITQYSCIHTHMNKSQSSGYYCISML